MKECNHNWFDDNFKNETVCENCGISYNEYVHKQERLAKITLANNNKINSFKTDVGDNK